MNALTDIHGLELLCKLQGLTAKNKIELKISRSSRNGRVRNRCSTLRRLDETNLKIKCVNEIAVMETFKCVVFIEGSIRVNLFVVNLIFVTGFRLLIQLALLM